MSVTYSNKPVLDQIAANEAAARLERARLGGDFYDPKRIPRVIASNAEIDMNDNGTGINWTTTSLIGSYSDRFQTLLDPTDATDLVNIAGGGWFCWALAPNKQGATGERHIQVIADGVDMTVSFPTDTTTQAALMCGHSMTVGNFEKPGAAVPGRPDLRSWDADAGQLRLLDYVALRSQGTPLLRFEQSCIVRAWADDPVAGAFAAALVVAEG